MRLFAACLALGIVSGVDAGQSFDPSETEFPWKNGPTRDARINLADVTNTVFVFEAFANFWGACNSNAPRVEAMSNEFDEDERILYKFYLVSSESLLPQHKTPSANLKEVNKEVYRLNHENISTYLNATENNDFNFSYTKKFYKKIADTSAKDIVQYLYKDE